MCHLCELKQARKPIKMFYFVHFFSAFFFGLHPNLSCCLKIKRLHNICWHAVKHIVEQGSKHRNGQGFAVLSTQSSPLETRRWKKTPTPKTHFIKLFSPHFTHLEINKTYGWDLSSKCAYKLCENTGAKRLQKVRNALMKE